MQKNLSINYNIEEKEYIQLFNNMPIVRTQKYLLAFTIIIVSTIVCYLVTLYVKSLNFTPNEYSNAKLIVIGVFVILALVLLINFRKKHKKMVFDIAKEKYQGLRGDEVNLTLDKDLNCITINNRNVPFVEEDIFIIHTPAAYFIYFGKQLYSDKVLIPKSGDDNFKNSVYELIDYLTKFKNIKIIERNR
ncbi:hypothetical protein [Sutcliffiella horikoshii]|uniref:YcxB-like protein domain-containing protein n=1 Tax=Sutcliffiella horikoshii TaxID=79883 RepID=A0A5D4TEH5_9BACI|nr:hypothetical protein [Sutcliffiella horikoshii]TYS73158.1 hypothetical protein FZC75_08920 [Sutcliffiella horikoshii]